MMRVCFPLIVVFALAEGDISGMDLFFRCRNSLFDCGVSLKPVG